MLVAIIADVHGNFAALEAVWADFKKHKPDLIVHAGDLVAKGARPAECVAWFQENQVPNVFGNTDLGVMSGVDPVELWNRARLNPTQLDYLAKLPITHRISPSEHWAPDKDLLIMHSTPRSCRDLLILEPHPASYSDGFQEPTAVEKVAEMLTGEQANLMVFGHIHYESARIVNGQRIASIGSVGFPYDADHRAAYALAKWDGQSWNLTHHRVAYDHASVEAEILASDMPNKKRYAEMIRQARWMPFDSI